MTSDLPKNGNVNAVREDLENPDLLFVGTEFGLYVSLDGGKAWKKFMSNLPSVRVDDILIHPRDRDLIIGTHGRSIWIADDISPLERLKRTDKGDLTLFEPRAAVLWKNDVQSQRHVANREFVGKNPQGGTAIHILAKSEVGAGKIEFLQNNKVAQHHGGIDQSRDEQLSMEHARTGAASQSTSERTAVVAAKAGEEHLPN